MIVLLVALGAGRASADDPVAVDAAAAVGIAYPGAAVSKSQGESVVFDYDGDGDLDVLLSAHNQMTWPLLRNDGGTFSEAPFAPVRQYDRHGCVSADLGSPGGGRPDGLQDVYCVVGACSGSCDAPFANELFLQQPDHRFFKVRGARGADDPHGRGRDVVARDFTGDGLTDLLVANNASPLTPTTIHLFKNTGSRFVDIADPALQSAPSASCVAAADIDGDGWQDFVLCNDKSVRLYRNVAGAFAPLGAGAITTGTVVSDVELADVNGDGRPDLLVTQASRISVRLNVGGRFPANDFVQELQAGHDVAVGDANGDGAPDLYVVQGRNAMYDDMMLINDGTGVGYHAIPLPQVREGDGDVATAIPGWRDGRAAFLVTNGKHVSTGPVQLITFEDAPEPAEGE